MAHEDAVDPLPGDASPAHALSSATVRDSAPSNLAQLLDRFSASVADPQSATVGSFAETVQALHDELKLLAHHFGAVAERAAEGSGGRVDFRGEEVIEADADLDAFAFDCADGAQPVR